MKITQQHTTPATMRPSNAAEYLGISISKFWSLVRESKIKVMKAGSRTTLIRRIELDLFLDRIEVGDTSREEY